MFISANAGLRFHTLNKFRKNHSWTQKDFAHIILTLCKKNVKKQKENYHHTILLDIGSWLHPERFNNMNKQRKNILPWTPTSSWIICRMASESQHLKSKKYISWPLISVNGTQLMRQYCSSVIGEAILWEIVQYVTPLSDSDYLESWACQFRWRAWMSSLPLHFNYGFPEEARLAPSLHVCFKAYSLKPATRKG